jgi:hypothetical protein
MKRFGLPLVGKSSLWLAVGALLAAATGCAASSTDETGTPTTTAPACQDRCVQSARQCMAGGYQECVKSATTACYDWGTVTTCPSGESCSGGTCQSSCDNDCTSGSTQCSDDGTAVKACEQVAGCWRWGAETACNNGETCSGGRCSTECVDDCATDARKCDGAGFRTCGNFDADSCLDWSTITACDAGQVCSNGYCAGACTNECTANSKACVGTSGTHECGNFDADSCLEWGPIVPCPQGQTCSNGTCSSSCTDECPSVGAKECTISGDGVHTCQSSGGCLVWGLPSSCLQGQVCSNGACVDACDCDFTHGICEPTAPGSTTACSCDPDCSGTSACGADAYCDSWCPPNVDPDCNCGCTYNEYCEADAVGSTGTCSCDPDCEVNEVACSDDGHCDTWCPAGYDPDCGVDACRDRWMSVGYRTAHQMWLSGSYEDPDSDEVSPWVQLSPGLSSGAAETIVEFAAEHASCIDSIRVDAWGYDDSIFGDGAEMYLYNWDTYEFDLLPDETIGSLEGWYTNVVLDFSPYVLCGVTYCYIDLKIGASSWDQTHLLDAEVFVGMSP